MRPINGFAIFLVHCVTGIVGTDLVGSLSIVDLVVLHPLLTAGFLHGNAALDHGLVFRVLHSLHFVLTQISVGI